LAARKKNREVGKKYLVTKGAFPLNNSQRNPADIDGGNAPLFGYFWLTL